MYMAVGVGVVAAQRAQVSIETIKCAVRRSAALRIDKWQSATFPHHHHHHHHRRQHYQHQHTQHSHPHPHAVRHYHSFVIVVWSSSKCKCLFGTPRGVWLIRAGGKREGGGMQPALGTMCLTRHWRRRRRASRCVLLPLFAHLPGIN